MHQGASSYRPCVGHSRAPYGAFKVDGFETVGAYLKV